MAIFTTVPVRLSQGYHSSDILEGPGPRAERKAAETSMRPMSLQEDMAANHDDDDDDDDGDDGNDGNDEEEDGYDSC